MKKELIAGKRYMWPVDNRIGARVVNGLFTGERKDNGNVVLVTKDGEHWSVPEDVVMPMPKKGV